MSGDDEPEVISISGDQALLLGMTCPACFEPLPLKVAPPGGDPIQNKCKCGNTTSAVTGVTDAHHVMVVIIHNDTGCGRQHSQDFLN